MTWKMHEKPESCGAEQDTYTQTHTHTNIKMCTVEHKEFSFYSITVEVKNTENAELFMSQAVGVVKKCTK